MDKKKADPKVVKEVAGDPAFYNDQISNDQEPLKAKMDENKGEASENEWPSTDKHQKKL